MSEALDVRAIRQRHNWTQEQLAEYLGLDRSTVSRLERGKEVKGPVAKLLRQLESMPATGDNSQSASGAAA